MGHYVADDWTRTYLDRCRTYGWEFTRPGRVLEEGGGDEALGIRLLCASQLSVSLLFMLTILVVYPITMDACRPPEVWKEIEMGRYMGGWYVFSPKRTNILLISRIGIVPPTPACRRALTSVVDALRCHGHEVVDL